MAIPRADGSSRQKTNRKAASPATARTIKKSKPSWRPKFGTLIASIGWDLPVADHLPTDICKTDPDLTAVVEAWPDLPEALKAGIVAMVKAASS